MVKRRQKQLPDIHRVTAEVSNVELPKAGSAITLKIYKAGEKLGELQVGRGSLYWFGKHRQVANRIEWGRFAELMNALDSVGT